LRFQFVLIIILFLCLIGISTCGRKMPLPVVQPTPESFGANDTSYIHLTPIWNNSQLGYQGTRPMAPVDIAIGEDGYLFVADSANDQIVVLSPAGEVVQFQRLNQIKPIRQPRAVDIDSKLNLVIVNGTDKIYVWNQYLNNIGVDSILTEITPDQHLIFEYNAEKIDSILGIHLLYRDTNENASFQGVALGPADDNTLFVTDKTENRILKLILHFTGAVKLKNGRVHPTFGATYQTDIATYGSGAGTVDDPRGITVDDDGNIYFIQHGGNFLVQKLKKQGEKYFSEFTLYEDAIMDLNRFRAPGDIALGKNDAIFVLDSGSGQVFKFFNKGARAGELANLGKKGLVEAVFNNPTGLAVSADEIVYVAETGKNQIRRYKFSVSEEDLPVEQP